MEKNHTSRAVGKLIRSGLLLWALFSALGKKREIEASIGDSWELRELGNGVY